MLSKNLEELESCKIVSRKQYNEIPPKVEYLLTPLGQAIKPIFTALGKWGIYAYNTINDNDIGK